MSLFEQQRFGYAHILLILVTENTILGIALRLIPQFTTDLNTRGEEGEGGKQYRQFL